MMTYAKFIKGNNKGKGFYYTTELGYSGWVYGLSKMEWNRYEHKYGRFTRYERA